MKSPHIHTSLAAMLPWLVHHYVPTIVMTESLGDRVAVQASRLGLSHWAGPSVTRSASESQSSDRGVIVDILAKESKFP